MGGLPRVGGPPGRGALRREPGQLRRVADPAGLLRRLAGPHGRRPVRPRLGQRLRGRRLADDLRRRHRRGDEEHPPPPHRRSLRLEQDPRTFLTGPRVSMDVPAGGLLTNRYLMTWMTGNGGRIDHDDSEDDRFGVNPIITGYASGTPYHLDVFFSIRDRLRDVTRNINWDALWAGFITQLVFGYFDFGQASLLYNHQWFMDVDTALKELVASQVRVARRMSSGEGFGAWFDEIETWLMRYGLSGLGLPDAVGRGIEMTGAVQERIADAILPDEVKEAISDLKRWFIDYVMEKAFGITLTEMEDALRDPATQFRNPLLFPAGTKEKIDVELGNFGRVFPVNECFRNSFAPFLDTLTMIKLQLVAPAELARVMFAERALPITTRPASRPKPSSQRSRPGLSPAASRCSSCAASTRATITTGLTSPAFSSGISRRRARSSSTASSTSRGRARSRAWRSSRPSRPSRSACPSRSSGRGSSGRRRGRRPVRARGPGPPARRSRSRGRRPAVRWTQPDSCRDR
ncbi:MAG: hypothetical protein MZU84_08265 [Sphingobacterium sp.]|nr:hypothetical protein [Sphingobacterium sp.]